MFIKEGNISDNTILQRNGNQLFSQVDGEVVMLSIENSEYFSFNAIGSHIWMLLNDPQRFCDIVSKLVELYEISKSDCEEEIRPFLNELMKIGIIDIMHE